MKKILKFVAPALAGLILACVLAHAILATHDTFRFARLEKRMATIKIGDTLDQVLTVMGKPNTRWEHTQDATMQDWGPGVAYRRNTNWKDPFFPFRIRQESHDSNSIVIYFDTNTLVREIQLPRNTD